jgi:hypothetical protein
VTFATLTASGRRLLTASARTHGKDIQTLFAVHYTAKELAALDALLGRLPGAGGDSEWQTP